MYINSWINKIAKTIMSWTNFTSSCELKRISLALLAILLLPFCALVAQDDDSLDIKLGQMLLVGFRGYTASLNSTIASDIKDRHIGGVILYDFDIPTKTKVRNFKTVAQVTKLVTQLKSYASIPLFVAIDQEGGYVSRLKEEYGFTKSYSQDYLGKKNDTSFTREVAEHTAKQMVQIGANMNFAPVVDVNTNKENPVIAKLFRSYSSSTKKVTRHALKCIEGLRNGGVFSAIKHFPGHGSSYYDSHEELANVTTTWDKKELLPFAEIIRKNACDMVMTAHIFNGKLDPDFPATLSETIITGMLRDSLGWQGVIVSDDMMMKAITSFYGFEKAIRLAINAGVDILIFSNNSTYDKDVAAKALRVLKHYVNNGSISRDRVNNSYMRIMRLKEKIR
jgi:beta-N-acetylhexosaminidase